jgi:hypothetical protein
VPIIVGLAAYFGAYLTTMGKNRAAKEYIGRITEETQKAIKPYAEQLVAFTKEIERRNALEEKGAENAFVLSATSHRAQVAFDEHVKFCNEYLAKAYEGLGILFRAGPLSGANSNTLGTSEPLKIATSLCQIRLKFVLWETKEVSLVLGRFETAFAQIAADAGLLGAVSDEKERVKMLHKIYERFKEVATLVPLTDKPTPETAIANIVACLRDHIGVPQLTDLRKHYLAEAAKRIK